MQYIHINKYICIFTCINNNTSNNTKQPTIIKRPTGRQA